jgi:hypothetical protein
MKYFKNSLRLKQKESPLQRLFLLNIFFGKRLNYSFGKNFYLNATGYSPLFRLYKFSSTHLLFRYHLQTINSFAESGNVNADFGSCCNIQIDNCVA